MTRKKTKTCWGCGDPFITFKNYDYCSNCAVNNNRYLSQSNCSECDGSGIIKFRGQKPRPCKLCHLTKKPMKDKNYNLLNKKDPATQFWKEVEKSSKSLIANLIEKTLPISTTPQVLDLEKDADYRTLLRADLPNYYSEQENYQAKITNQSWTKEDVDYVAQDITCAYFDLVVQALVAGLSDYPTFANTNLAHKFMN